MNNDDITRARNKMMATKFCVPKEDSKVRVHSAWVWVLQRCFSILLWKKLSENKCLEGVKLTQTGRWDRLLVNELSFKISFILIKFVNSVVRASNFIGFELNNTFDLVDGTPNHFSISYYIPASDIIRLSL